MQRGTSRETLMNLLISNFCSAFYRAPGAGCARMRAHTRNVRPRLAGAPGYTRVHGSKVTQAEFNTNPYPITTAYMAEGPADVDLILIGHSALSDALSQDVYERSRDVLSQYEFRRAMP